MTSMATRHWLTSMALELNPFWDRWVQRMRAAMKNFDARWEARARQAIAVRELRLLSDRECGTWDSAVAISRASRAKQPSYARYRCSY